MTIIIIIYIISNKKYRNNKTNYKKIIKKKVVQEVVFIKCNFVVRKELYLLIIVFVKSFRSILYVI